jgi:hypothetical protein
MRYSKMAIIDPLGTLKWLSLIIRYQFLGVTLDQKLGFSKHIKSRLQQAIGARRRLQPLLRSRKLSFKCKTLLYTSILRPMILYASQVWLTCANSHLQKLESFQSKTLRWITAAPWFVRNEIIRRDLNVETIKEHIIRLSKRFYSDPEKTGNRPLIEALNYNTRIIGDYKARPKQVIKLLADSSEDTE